MDRTKIDASLSLEDEQITVDTTDRTITRQLQLLESHRGEKPQVWKLEPMGKFILSMYGENRADSDST